MTFTKTVVYPIQYNKAVAVHTKLDSVLSTLYLKNPAIKYVEEGYNVHHEDAPDATTEANRTISTNVADSVNVFVGCDFVGKLQYRRAHRNDGSVKMIYCIHSQKIQKERGSPNEIRTTDANKAAREAVKLFTPLEKEEIWRRLSHANTEMFSRMISNTNVNYVLDGRSQPDAVKYFHAVLTKGETPDVPESVKQVFTEKLLQKLDDLDVLESLAPLIKAHKAYGISVYQDDTIRAVRLDPSNSEVETYKSMDEMPEWMRDKFLLLKILEGNQAIRHVGCRFKDIYSMGEELKDTYIVTEGAMTHLM